jgi:hypothetical protein
MDNYPSTDQWKLEIEERLARANAPVPDQAVVEEFASRPKAGARPLPPLLRRLPA